MSYVVFWRVFPLFVINFRVTCRLIAGKCEGSKAAWDKKQCCASSGTAFKNVETVVGMLHASQLAHVLVCQPIHCQLVLCQPICCLLVLCTPCTLPAERMHASCLPVVFCQPIHCQLVLCQPIYCPLYFARHVLCLLRESTPVLCLQYFACVYFACCTLPVCTLPVCSFHMRYIVCW